MLRVYLDNNASTPVLPEVLAAMQPYFAESFGNPSSIHQNGQAARAAIEDARESVARLIGARGSEIVFTSGGTEADNLAVAGIAAPGDHIITSSIEHHAVLHACRYAASQGCEVTEVPVNGTGVVDPADVRRAIRRNTRLISVMFANNETGVLQPVDEIGKIAAGSGIHFHTDAVQGAGKIALDVTKIGCSLMSLSGHKMHAPQGVGALFVRKGTQVRASLQGGPQERFRRAGTENVPGIVGLGRAASASRLALSEPNGGMVEILRNRLEQGILNRVDGCTVNSGPAPRTPNTASIRFDCIDGEAMVIALDLQGVAASSGAACSSGATKPSHVLTAMGLTPAQARSTIRFSLGRQTTEADIDFALDAVIVTVARLRALSPRYSAEMVRS